MVSSDKFDFKLSESLISYTIFNKTFHLSHTVLTQSRCSVNSLLLWAMWEIRAGNSIKKSMYVTETGCDGSLTEIKTKHYVHSHGGKLHHTHGHEKMAFKTGTKR